MNGAIVLGVGTLLFALAFRFYGRRIERLFGIDPARPTPANTLRDGIDYVPTRPVVLFGHHFASIAGAGPIVGPVLAAHLGWGAVALWILLGCILVGGMHDMAALFLSVRDNGRSIGHAIERQLGYRGRQMFLAFGWATLVLVVAVFANLVSSTFVANPAAASASLLFVFMAPGFGSLVYRGRMSLGPASLLFVPLLFLAVWLGVLFPLDLCALFGLTPDAAARVWLLVLLAYAALASALPVWLLLQPRDYLNSFLLLAMLILGVGAVLWARPPLLLPAFQGWGGAPPGGEGAWVPVFPMLFVTVACGACSGFHALVASGTTAKQLDNERNIRPVAYGAMLVEGVLGLLALISVAALSRAGYWEAVGTDGSGAVRAFAGGIAALAAGFGLPEQIGVTFITLAVAAFLLTTLDTATRLARFSWQEMFLPRAEAAAAPGRIRRSLSHVVPATGVVLVLAAWLSLSGGAGKIWSVFGASNQLLAALTLLGITLFLVRSGKSSILVWPAMLFMLGTSLWALGRLLMAHWGRNWSLVSATAILILLAFSLCWMAARSAWTLRRRAAHG